MDNEFVHLRDVVTVMTHAQFFKNSKLVLVLVLVVGSKGLYLTARGSRLQLKKDKMADA